MFSFSIHYSSLVELNTNYLFMLPPSSIPAPSTCCSQWYGSNQYHQLLAGTCYHVSAC